MLCVKISTINTVFLAIGLSVISWQCFIQGVKIIIKHLALRHRKFRICLRKHRFTCFLVLHSWDTTQLLRKIVRKGRGRKEEENCTAFIQMININYVSYKIRYLYWFSFISENAINDIHVVDIKIIKQFSQTL